MSRTAAFEPMNTDDQATSQYARPDKGKRRAEEDFEDPEQGDQARAIGYTWEGDFERTWDAVREDAAGSLEGAVNDFLQQTRRKRALRDSASIQRGIIRHLYLVLDLSLSMTERDLRPTRIELSLQYSTDFVGEYFDQNPISQLAIIGTKDGIATRVTALSGNAIEHQAALKRKDERSKMKLEPSGEPSLQNALEMARNGLSHLPTHGSREILVIFSSLTTCDPRNIHSTIEALVKDKIRVSIIGLSAEMAVCRDICRRTGGQYSVAINEAHFKDLLLALVPPPAIRSERSGSNAGRSAAELMPMGFPSRCPTIKPTLCACHVAPRSAGFLCPRCKSKVPHLARSYRHLFPVQDYLESNGPAPEGEMPRSCYGCCRQLDDLAIGNTAAPLTSNNRARQTEAGRAVCPRCQRHFCLNCDILAHEVLAVCPGCA